MVKQVHGWVVIWTIKVSELVHEMILPLRPACLSTTICPSHPTSCSNIHIVRTILTFIPLIYKYLYDPEETPEMAAERELQVMLAEQLRAEEEEGLEDAR